MFLYLYINSFCFLRALKCWHSKPAKGQTAAIIDGKSIAHDIKSKIAGEIRRTKAATGKCPGLAVVLVGKRRDSRTFINIKQKACDDVGIATLIAELPETCTESELLHVVSGFNEDPSVHGIIVQLPLPQVISTTASDFELLPLFIYYAFKAFKTEKKSLCFRTSVFVEMLWPSLSRCDLTNRCVRSTCVLMNYDFCFLNLLFQNIVLAVSCAGG